MIDTGAAVTLMSVGFYYSIPSEKRPELKKLDTNLKLEVANDGLVTVEGTATFEFKLRNTTFEWEMYVTPIREDGLLGLDFLYNHKYVCGVDQGLRLNGKKYPTFIQMAPFGVSRVSCKTETVIPANSEYVINGETDNFPYMASYCVVGPNQDGTSETLLVGNALVTAGEDIPIPVMNLSNEDVTIYQGQNIACLQEIEDIIEFKQETSAVCSESVFQVRNVGTNSDITNWPDGVKALFNQSSETLQEDEKHTLAKLLSKHVSAFASSPNDLGFTSVIQHTIDTGVSVPVKQAPRRPPMAFAKEEEKIIETQLKNGVITQSNSPWASPLVYVRKKDGSTRPCVDYRRLNKLTRKDAFPLPRMDDCLDSLSNASVFSSLDLQSGYWQIAMAPEDRAKQHL